MVGSVASATYALPASLRVNTALLLVSLASDPVSAETEGHAQLNAITVFGTTDTKTVQSAFEMPFTVNSVTRDIVDEQQATLLKDIR